MSALNRFPVLATNEGILDPLIEALVLEVDWNDIEIAEPLARTLLQVEEGVRERFEAYLPVELKQQLELELEIRSLVARAQQHLPRGDEVAQQLGPRGAIASTLRFLRQEFQNSVAVSIWICD